jgi:hypothetical protein
MDDSLPQWFEENFPPLAIYHGGHDYLVAAGPLIERIKNQEKHVRIARIEHLNESEVSMRRCSQMLDHMVDV